MSERTHQDETDSVVAFMVNVRLVEKSVKSHVGRVMLVNVTVQYSTAGISLRTEINSLAVDPHMELDAILSTAGKSGSCEKVFAIDSILMGLGRSAPSYMR